MTQRTMKMSQWHFLPLQLLAILLVGILLLVVVVAINRWHTNTPVELEQSELIMAGELPAIPEISTPEPQLPQLETSTSVILPPLEVEWVEIGKARNGKEVRALPIPWGISSFMGWSEAEQQLDIPPELKKIGGYGDGTIFALYPRWTENFFLTVDLGRSWYPILKPLGGHLGPTYATEDGTVIVHMVTGSSSWEFTYWRAEIKGLSSS